MDRGNSFLLSIINKARANNQTGYWEMISAAANDSKAVEKIRNSICVAELRKGAMSEITVSPSIVEMRIEAFSVCDPESLKILWKELRDVDEGNPFIQAAMSSLERIIFPQKVDFNKEPWHWSDHITALPPEGFLLSQRPMHDIDLTTNDLIIAANNGGGILRALRHQNISLDNVDFSYWLNNISSIESWTLALVIELSRKADIPIEQWRERYIKYFKDITEPLEFIPSIYTLISPDWVVP
jgi:hypothetical protein